MKKLIIYMAAVLGAAASIILGKTYVDALIHGGRTMVIINRYGQWEAVLDGVLFFLVFTTCLSAAIILLIDQGRCRT